MSVMLLVLAALLDYLIGDPWNWLHPVQVMGALITAYTNLAQRLFDSVLKAAWAQRLAGIGLMLGLVLGSLSIGMLIQHGLQNGLTHSRMYATGPLVWLQMLVSGVCLASCFAGRSLRSAAQDVLVPLGQGDLEESRSRLARYVGRDTKDLNESEILRAVLETVAENSVDGVLAPLFWAIVGAFTPVGALGLALAYKAASTLDSMVGYRTFPYQYLGWASAKTDDVLTWIPCRLAVLSIALLSGRAAQVLRICRRDGDLDPSPNSGWSEAAYAAALGVQLGGDNFYQGQARSKPLLGEPTRSISATSIDRALQLTRVCFLAWLTIALVIDFTVL